MHASSPTSLRQRQPSDASSVGSSSKNIPKIINMVSLLRSARDHLRTDSGHFTSSVFDPDPFVAQHSTLATKTPDGEYVFPDGILLKQEPLSLLESVQAVVILLIMLMGFMIGIPLITLYLLVTMSPWFLPLLITMLLLGLIPVFHPWPPTGANSRLFELLVKYFSVKVIIEEPLSPDQLYIFAASPHGVFPFANMCTGPCFQYMFKFSIHCLAATPLTIAPILHHFMDTLGMIDASQATAQKTLEKGRSIGITVGGVAEIFEVWHRNEHAVLHNRKGFIKLAFKTGASVVPCYNFGNTEAMECVVDRFGLMKSISRRLRFSLTYPYGRWYLPLPYRVPLVVACGKPIAVPKKDDPTDDEIDRVHEQFEKEMAAVFEKYKGAYGWNDKNLHIR